LFTQTTKEAPFGRRAVERRFRSVDVALALDFFPADAVRFIPVKFSQPDVSVVETNLGHSLHLPPARWAVQTFQTSQIPDALARGDDLDLGDLTDNGSEISQVAFF
jgi:hypothetical protein